MKKDKIKRPKGELYKIQFKKTITIVGKTTFDEETGKYHIQSVDNRTGKPINSWIDERDVRLLEDANDYEKKRFERYESSLGERPPNEKKR